MTNYSGVIFDLDGTLTDSVPLIIEAISYTVKKLHMGVFTEEKLKEMVGPPLEHGFGEILGFSEEQVKTAIEVYRDYYEPLQTEVPLFPGTLEFLRALRAKNIPLVVASAKRQAAVTEVVKAKKLDKYLITANGLLAQDHLSGRSSKTAVISRAISALNEYADERGLAERNWVMVGDRLDDYNGARANNIEVIGVNWGAGKADEFPQAKYVDSFSELFFCLTGCDLRLSAS